MCCTFIISLCCVFKVHRCERCDNYETLSRAALLTHLAQCQGNGENETVRHHRKMFECDVCNMKFSNGANMRRHKMRHTGVKPYECRVCQKRFFRKDHLAEHFTTHTKTLPYHCPICNRGFQRQIAMRAHFQNEHVGQHDMIKSCPLCSYRAGSMKSLRVHFFNRYAVFNNLFTYLFCFYLKLNLCLNTFHADILEQWLLDIQKHFSIILPYSVRRLNRGLIIKSYRIVHRFANVMYIPCQMYCFYCCHQYWLTQEHVQCAFLCNLISVFVLICWRALDVIICLKSL